MEVAANRVECDEGLDCEVRGEVEAEFWVEENCGEDVEVRRVGPSVDVSRRREDEASTFAFMACHNGPFNAVWRGVEGSRDGGTRPLKCRGFGASVAGGRQGGVEGEVADASVWDIGY